MSQTTITISYENPETSYDPFDIDLGWNREPNPDVARSTIWSINDWDFSSDADKAQYDKIIADGVDKTELDSFIDSRVGEADPPDGD